MEVKVCIGEFCHFNGAEIVVKRLQELLHNHNASEPIALKGCFCIRKCQEAGVAVQVEDDVHTVTPDAIDDFFHNVILPALPAPPTLSS